MITYEICLHFLTSLSVILSRSIHITENGIISFLWLNNIPYIYIYMRTTSSSSIHLSMDVSVVHVLAIVNSAAMNIGVPASFQIKLLSGYFPGVGLLDQNSVFSFLRNLHIIFHTNMLSYEEILGG